MAKTNDDFDFEDFSMDDFGDEGTGGFDGKTTRQDRSPVTVLAGSFKDGIKTQLTDRSNQIGFLKAALPGGYQQAIDAVDKTVGGAKSLYDTAVREAAPVIKEFKRGVKMSMPAVKSILPKGLADKLEAWTTEVGSSSSNFDPDENEITTSLGGIFAAIGEDQRQRDNEAQTAQAARDYALAKQTGDTIKQLIGVQYNTGRLVSYQDQVTSKYQQKSLELQYRQYFTTRKLLNVFEQHLDLSKTSFEIIVKNTALPELVKQQNSEIAKDMMKRKFLGTVTEPMSKWFSGIGQRIVTKGKADIARFFKDVGGQVSDIMGMAESVSGSMEDGQGESGRDMALDIAGSTAGGAFASKVANMIARGPLARKLQNINGFDSGNQILKRMFNNMPEILNDFLKQKGGEDSIAGKIASYIQSANGVYTRDNTVQTSLVDSLDQQMVFDLQTKRTITDVIPGWLAKIHNELEMTRTGNDKLEEQSYSWESGSFETKQRTRERLHEKLYNKDDLKRARDLSIKIMNKIDPNQSDDDNAPQYGLSSSIRTKLRKYIERRTFDGASFNMDYLVSPTAPLATELKMTSTEVEELQLYLKTAEHLGYDSRKYESETEWDPTTHLPKGFKAGRVGAFKRQAAITGISELTTQLRDAMPNQHQAVIDMYGQGKGDVAKGFGLTEVDLKTDTVSMNPEKLLAAIHSESQIPSASMGRKHADGGHILANSPLNFNGGGDTTAPSPNGRLVGPGGETSDSIPANLSNNEFVVRAAAVNRPGVLPLLRYLNDLGSDPIQTGGHIGTHPTGNLSTLEDGIAAMSERVSLDIRATNQLLTEMFTNIKEFASKPILTFNIPDLPDFDMSKLNLSSLSFGETGMLKLFRGAQNVGRWGLGAAKSVAGATWDRAGRIANGTLDIGADVLQAGVKGVKALYRGAEGIYVKGSSKILLTVSDFAIQDYIDVNTDKVIKNLKDITGAVVDRGGNVIITAEQYAKGIYYSKGKRAMAWLSGVGESIKGVAKGAWSALSIIPASLKSAGNFMMDVLEMPDDIYVEGDDPWQPRLEARIFKQRGYRLFTTKEVITRVSQITAPVIGTDDNIVVSDEDLKRGLVDVNHEPIRGLKGRIVHGLKEGANKAIKLFKAGVGHAQDILFGMLGGVKNFFTGRSWGISLFTSAETTVTRLEQIYALLNDRLPGTPSTLPSDFGKRRPPPDSDDPEVKAALAASHADSTKASAVLRRKAKEAIANSPTGSRIADMINGWTARLTGDQSAEYEAYLQAHANPDNLPSVPKPQSAADQFVGPMPQSSLGRMYSGFKELWADENRIGAVRPVDPKSMTGRITGIINSATGMLNGEPDQSAEYQAYLKAHANPDGLDDPQSMVGRMREGLQSGIQAIQSDFKDRAEYRAYLKRTAALNPTREGEDRINTGSHVASFINGLTRRINGDGSTVEVPKDETDTSASFSDRFRAYIDTSETAEMLRSTEIYQTLFSDPNVTEAKRNRLMDRIAAVDDDLIRRIMASDGVVKERIVQLANAVDKDGTIESLERYLNFVTKLKDPAAGPSKSMTDNLKDKVKGLWDDWGKPKDAGEQPRDDDAAYQQWLESSGAYNDDRSDGVGSRAGQRMRTWGWRAKENLAADGQSILDAFRKSSGMADFGKGRLRDFDVESMFRNKDTLAANKAKKAADAAAKAAAKVAANEFKDKQREWDVQYFTQYSARQAGEISRLEFEAWMDKNPSPQSLVDKAKADAKAKTQAAADLDKAERKAAKDGFDQSQAEWEIEYGKKWAAMARGTISKDEFEAWVAINPSPKAQRAAANKKKGVFAQLKDAFKPDYRDKDGDGDRDGSTKDQAEQKEKSLWKKMQEGYAKGAAGESRTMRERMDAMMAKVPSIFDAAGGLLGKVVDALGPLGQVLMMAKSAGVFALLGGAKLGGAVIGAARWAKNGGIAATAVRGAVMAGSMGTAIMGAASSMAVMGATALGAIIASPLLIPGLIIAGGALAIYGAVKVYDHYNQPDSPIAKFRMAQYGYEVDDEEHVAKLIELETRCSKIVSVSKGQQAQLRAGETAESLMAIFKVDMSDKDAVERWITWFVKRFKPVFLAHTTMLYDLVGKSDISKADKLLTSEQRITYLNAVHFKGANTPYNVFASPFSDDDEVDVYNSTWSDDVDDAYEDAIDWSRSHAAETDAALAKSKEKPKEKPKAEKTWWEKTVAAKNAAKDKVVNVLSDAMMAFDNAESTNYVRDKLTDLIGFGDRVLTSMGNGYQMALSRKTGGGGGGWSSKKSAQFDSLIKATAARYGIDEAALRGMAFIESKGDARAYHSGSGAAGIFQFTKATGAEYGLIDPLNGADYRFDEAKNIDAGARMYLDNKRKLKDAYGIDADPHLMYLRHQQGPGGFAAIMNAIKTGADPSTIMLKASTDGPVYSLRKAMDSNGGTGLSPQQYLEYWRDRYKKETFAANVTATPMAAPPTTAAKTTTAAATPLPATAKPLTPVSKAPETTGKATPAKASPANAAPTYQLPPPPDTARQAASGRQVELVNVTGVAGGATDSAEMARLGAIGKRVYRLADEGVDMGLNPAFLSIIYALFGDYYERVRKPIVVTSAFRTKAKQQQLYDAYCRGGTLAAKPGTSRHESGVAIDIDGDAADYMAKVGLLKKYGLHRPYLNHPRSKERWHIELIGGPKADMNCSDTDLFMQPPGAQPSAKATKAVEKAKAKESTPMAKALAKPKATDIPNSSTTVDPTPAADAAAATAPTAAIEPAVETATPAAVPMTPVDAVVPEDILRSQDRSTTAAQTAAMEQQRQDATVSAATGIDGAVELLRSQVKLSMSMDTTLSDINATLKRMEQMTKVEVPKPAAGNAAKASIPRANTATSKETRTPPVSVSRT